MKYCLIGETLKHSYSVDIHEKNGFDYTLRELKKEDLGEFFRKREFDGFNVTVPYKKTATEYLDYIDDEAKKTGSVNTVINVNGKLTGYNTDVYGLEFLFKRAGENVYGKNVLIAGTGGASAAAVTFAKKSGAKKIAVVSRKGDINYENCYDLLPDTEIIINATPAGMFPEVNGKLFDLKWFKKLRFVADCVYNPLKTNLIIDAEELGVKCSGGLPMLVGQAVKAEEIWTGKSYDYSAEKLLSGLYLSKSNLVLYGMPSCGKSLIGKKAAEILQREFFDSDKVFEKEFGITPEEFIVKFGEEEFREKESETIEKLSLKNGCVISVGGGAVIKKSNARALKRNGVLCYVKRDLSLLSDCGRPISKAKGIENLYNERKDIYESIKDFFVYNDDNTEEVAKRAVKGYENSCNKRR